VVASSDGLGKRSVGTPFYVGRSGQLPAARDLPSAFGVDHVPIRLSIVAIAWDNDANKNAFLTDFANGQKIFLLPRQYPRPAKWIGNCRRDCPQVSCNCLDRAQAIHVFGMRGVTSDS